MLQQLQRNSIQGLDRLITGLLNHQNHCQVNKSKTKVNHLIQQAVQIRQDLVILTDKCQHLALKLHKSEKENFQMEARLKTKYELSNQNYEKLQLKFQRCSQQLKIIKYSNQLLKKQLEEISSTFKIKYKDALHKEDLFKMMKQIEKELKKSTKSVCQKIDSFLCQNKNNSLTNSGLLKSNLPQRKIIVNSSQSKTHQKAESQNKFKNRDQFEKNRKYLLINHEIQNDQDPFRGVEIDITPKYDENLRKQFQKELNEMECGNIFKEMKKANYENKSVDRNDTKQQFVRNLKTPQEVNEYQKEIITTVRKKWKSNTAREHNGKTKEKPKQIIQNLSQNHKNEQLSIPTKRKSEQLAKLVFQQGKFSQIAQMNERYLSTDLI